MLTAQQATADAELAMLVQGQILAAQLEAEDRRFTLPSLLSGIESFLAPAAPPRPAPSAAAVPVADNDLEAARRLAVSRRTLPPPDDALSRASSFFSTFGEDVKRKINEVAVKFQAVTGSGGYATTEEGTSCGIDDTGEETGLVAGPCEARLRRQQRPGLESSSGSLPSRSPAAHPDFGRSKRE
jgi:hypothetical protein